MFHHLRDTNAFGVAVKCFCFLWVGGVQKCTSEGNFSEFLSQKYPKPTPTTLPETTNTSRLGRYLCTPII